MEAMRHSWTDDRIDDLSNRMDQRFDHLEAEMDQRFAGVKAEIERVDGEVRALRGDMRENQSELRILLDRHNCERQAEFNALHRTLIQFIGGLMIALLGVLVAAQL